MCVCVFICLSFCHQIFICVALSISLQFYSLHILNCCPVQYAEVSVWYMFGLLLKAFVYCCQFYSVSNMFKEQVKDGIVHSLHRRPGNLLTVWSYITLSYMMTQCLV